MPTGDVTDRSRGVVRLFRKSPYFWLFMAAVVLRFTYNFQSTANPLFGAPLVDAADYDQWANRIVRGHWLWDRVELYTPVYPYFLALLKIVFGGSIAAIRFVQSIMGAGAAVLLGKVAERLWDRKVGLLTTVLSSANWMLIIYDNEEYAESFSIFFQNLALWLVFCRTGGIFRAFIAGIAFALSVGARANLLLCLPIVLAGLFLTSRVDRKKAWIQVTAALAGVALLLGPILLRNHQISGAWMLRWGASWSLYSGLAPEFNGLHPPAGVLYDNYMRQPLQQGLRSEPDLERYWEERLGAVLKNDPGGVAKNFLQHALIFLNAREWSQEFDVYAYRSYSWILSLPWPHVWLIVPFGLVGIIFCTRRSPERWLLLGFLILSALSMVPFKASGRYRLPTLVILVPFAAAALVYLAGFVRARQWRTIVVTATLIALFGVVSWPDWLHLDQRQTARHWFFVGLWKKQLGCEDEAIAAFKKSMNQFSWDADSPCRIGFILFERGDEQGARPWFETALKREPEFAEALTYLARIDLNEGKTASADDLAARALRLYPVFETALLLQARIRQAQGRTEEELALYDRIIRDYDDPAVIINLGLRLEDLGRIDDAFKWYGRVIETDSYPAFDRARAGLLAGYLLARRANQPNRARDLWLMVTKRFPSETFFVPQALFLSREIDESEYHRRVALAPSATALEFLWFNLGLARRLGDDTAGARQAYEKCLGPSGDQPKKSLSESLPLKWSREELKIIDAKPGAK